MPDEIRSDRFTAVLDGQPATVTHAAMSYHFLNFEVGKGGADLSITGPSDDYWDKGVEVQPWRWNIRPAIHGRTITFHVAEPMKLSVTRPGDHLAKAEMLFVFANAPETNLPKPDDPKVRYFAAGVYHENIDLHSGERVYLAAGAVVFGSINIWGVENVSVEGRGTVIYDGPQSASSDTGWMHKPNWHVIVMDHARNVHISGITCIVRSRTWMIQMLASRFITFDNVKTIGGCPGNANQDGMDWLGGGDTVVTDCFFRASDDIFALYGNWLGYEPKALMTPGEDVENIRIERCVLSTSISNVVRVSWPRKVFNSRNFVMRDTDVIHMGIGGCGIPFALMEIWADPGGKGQHTGYRFENIRLENWYTLLQLRQPDAEVRDIRFSNIWAEEQPQLETSNVIGDVKGVSLQHVKFGNRLVTSVAEMPLVAERGGTMPTLLPDAMQLNASFVVRPGNVKPGTAVTFDASASRVPTSAGAIRYEWMFGDGTVAAGRVVTHAFPDDRGTLMDGSGRFRVMLKVTDEQGDSDWAGESLVVVSHLEEPVAVTEPIGSGLRHADYIDVPRDGGYSFFLQSRDASELWIDSKKIAQSPPSVPQVCGSVGNAVQMVSGSIGLRAGKHEFRMVMTKGDEAFRISWAGPGIVFGEVPASALSHGGSEGADGHVAPQ